MPQPPRLSYCAIRSNRCSGSTNCSEATWVGSHPSAESVMVSEISDTHFRCGPVSGKRVSVISSTMGLSPSLM